MCNIYIYIYIYTHIYIYIYAYVCTDVWIRGSVDPWICDVDVCRICCGVPFSLLCCYRFYNRTIGSNLRRKRKKERLTIASSLVFLVSWIPGPALSSRFVPVAYT